MVLGPRDVNFVSATLIQASLEGKLRALATSLGVSDRVTVTGYVDESYLRNALTRATVFAMPSIAELPDRLDSVLSVVYLVFNEGYSGDVDLAAEAIRLTRQLATMTNHEEVAGLLALMLLPKLLL